MKGGKVNIGLWPNLGLGDYTELLLLKGTTWITTRPSTLTDWEDLLLVHTSYYITPVIALDIL